MTAYYNEIDPYAAQWLRNLISAGHIASGDVDERSIVDVRGSDLAGYDQCHFFAGIGGWSVALRLAGWDDDRPVWTGSCPCQPFSAAGAGKAADDKRHLWPAWLPLIAERRPPVVFGEQVEAAIGWGWIDAVFADLEGEGYACGATVLPACGIGAPHIRQRLWFVANTECERAERGIAPQEGSPNPRPDGAGELLPAVGPGSIARELADSECPEWRPHDQFEQQEAGRDQAPSGAGFAGAGGLRMADTASGGLREFGDASQSGRSRHADGGFWSRLDWLPCTDGKARPVEPGTFPLAHGVQRRTSKLRAYGNAIVPQVAAEFIIAARFL